MPNHKSAIKRARQTPTRTLRNRSVKSALKTILKNVDLALVENDNEKITTALGKAIPAIDKACSKGVIHKNNAARKKSRLVKRVNAVLK